MRTKGCYTSQGSTQQAAGDTSSHAWMPGIHMFTHMHSHAHWAVPVTSFLGDSAQLESHTSESPRASSSRRGESEEREPLGRLEVHRVVGSGCRRCFGPLAEGGGGEGSDFLALGWLLGVGRSDYRGTGTQPAGTGIMRCLPKRRHPLEHREAHTTLAWNRAQGLLLPQRSQPEPFSLACGQLAPWGLVSLRILTSPAGSAA